MFEVGVFHRLKGRFCELIENRKASVNNGRPVTINGRGCLFRSWYRYMKKSEICFTDGVEKSTEFSLHHFSNRAHFDL